FELRQGDRFIDPEAADHGAPQSAQVGTATERGADVHRQAANVGALAAGDAKREPIDVEGQQIERMDADAARRTLELDTGPGVLVQGLAVALERGIHRGDLLDLTAKARESRLQLRRLDRHRTGGDDRTI